MCNGIALIFLLCSFWMEFEPLEKVDKYAQDFKVKNYNIWYVMGEKWLLSLNLK